MPDATAPVSFENAVNVVSNGCSCKSFMNLTTNEPCSLNKSNSANERVSSLLTQPCT